MRYFGTAVAETIMVNPMDDLNAVHCITLEKSVDEPVFYVTCCCDEDWFYEFYMTNNSDYERIKYNIMETMFECETMEELLDALSELFEEGFSEMLVKDECNGNCGCCDCK